jgi:CheY-like chemotaxis protein
MPQKKNPHKILIVEDEKAMLQALIDTLRAAGFSAISQARDGKEGLAAALKEKPDLILLDIIMPKMDGMMMLKSLRLDPRTENIKVILLTNLAVDRSIMQGVVDNELTYYLVKTETSIEDIVRKVELVLGVL